MEELIILVDQQDQEVGYAEKMKAHTEGQLHRSFSIFVFNSQGNLLLQKRAETKYHCGGLWSNTCCSHPRIGESLVESTHRRLKEEMGFDCELREIFSFVYRVEVENKLIEHEYNHVFVGTFDLDPTPNLNEVDDWKWANLQELRKDFEKYPDSCTPWFRMSLDKMGWNPPG